MKIKIKFKNGKVKTYTGVIDELLVYEDDGNKHNILPLEIKSIHFSKSK